MGSVNMTLITSTIASTTDDYYIQNVLEENMFGIERPIKHLLGSSWTFWFYKNDRSQSWKQSQRAVMTFSTVEDFWALTHHLMLASELPPGSDYALFKEGKFPDWEDRRNAPGGRWIIATDRRQREVCLDNYWMEVLLLLIVEIYTLYLVLGGYSGILSIYLEINTF